MSIKLASGTGPALDWVKSSYSTADGPQCVEVAAVPGTVLVRDSKNPQGPQLSLPPSTWRAFVTYATGR